MEAAAEWHDSLGDAERADLLDCAVQALHAHNGDVAEASLNLTSKFDLQQAQVEHVLGLVHCSQVEGTMSL